MDQRERIADPLTTMSIALQGHQAQIWTALPGVVQSFDPGAMTASVQPSVKGRQISPKGVWTDVNLPLLPSCPVVFPHGGGSVLTFPLAAGDEGLLIFSCRCIDAVAQEGGIQPQAQLRMHDLSDAFFLPGWFSKPNVPPAVSSSSCQLRSIDGSTYVELAAGQVVNIVAPGGVNIVGDLTVTGNISMAGGSGDEALVTGSLHVTGAGRFDGDVTAGGKSLETHVHGGVTTGGGDTGPPV